MIEVENLKNVESYIRAANILRIANKAVQKAKEENQKLGLPEFFWKNGKMYFVLENGELTTQRPAILERS